MLNEEEKLEWISQNLIRREYDEKIDRWYFSIVDIIAVTDLSKDPRNYWKVFKNRLNKTKNKLVTECNQVKMKAKDGKFYLTDVADKKTLLEIIQLISPEYVNPFKKFFTEFKENCQTVPSFEENVSLHKKNTESSYPQVHNEEKNIFTQKIKIIRVAEPKEKKRFRMKTI